MTRGRRAGIAVAAFGGAVALVLVGVQPLRGETVDRLPNLDAAAPGELAGRTEVKPGGRRFYLGFESAAGNFGDGPLLVQGRRASVSESRMTLDQEITRSDGTSRFVPVAADLRYVRSPTHSHWHMLGFMRYELRALDRGQVLRDRKTGFCLGDRYRLGVTLDRAREKPLFTDECGKGAPKLLSLRSGISVGYGDNYAPNLEGQEFDVTELPAGRYLLVHRVNPGRVLRESDYSDNASSLVLALAWPNGRSQAPRVDVIERCPSTPTCSGS